MEEPNLNIKTVSIDTLEYDPFNVREHDERNVEAIKASLQRFGQQKPIVVKKDGTVIAGNGTLGAMRILGYKEVVIAETELDGEEAVAFSIADNRTAELATWDDVALTEALDQLNEDLLPATGYDESELDELIKSMDPEDVGAPGEGGDYQEFLKDLEEDGELEYGSTHKVGKNSVLVIADPTKHKEWIHLIDDSIDRIMPYPGLFGIASSDTLEMSYLFIQPLPRAGFLALRHYERVSQND